MSLVKWPKGTRQVRERQIVRGVIRALRAAGWQPHSVHDGEERYAARNETAMLANAFAVDMASLSFKHADAEKRCVVEIVLGNGDGRDVIADHSAPEPDPHAFAATIDAYMRRAGLIG